MWIQQILFEQEIPEKKKKDPFTGSIHLAINQREKILLVDRGSHLNPGEILDVLNKIMFSAWCLPMAVL